MVETPFRAYGGVKRYRDPSTALPAAARTATSLRMTRLEKVSTEVTEAIPGGRRTAWGAW